MQLCGDLEFWAFDGLNTSLTNLITYKSLTHFAGGCTSGSTFAWIRIIPHLRTMTQIFCSIRNVHTKRVHHPKYLGALRRWLYIDFPYYWAVVNIVCIWNIRLNLVCVIPFPHPCRRLTLTPLTWKIWWAPNNASKWQTGFNLAFKGLKKIFTASFRETCQWLKFSLNWLRAQSRVSPAVGLLPLVSGPACLGMAFPPFLVKQLHRCDSVVISSFVRTGYTTRRWGWLLGRICYSITHHYSL